MTDDQIETWYICTSSKEKIRVLFTDERRQHLLVGNRRTSSGSRTRTNTSSCGWPNGDPPC